jgi:hypothetical protein
MSTLTIHDLFSKARATTSSAVPLKLKHYAVFTPRKHAHTCPIEEGMMKRV